MQDAELISRLEEVILGLGMELRWERGDFRGGVCRLGERTVLMVNSDLPSFEKVRILCGELSRQDLSQVYLLPALRRLLCP